MQTRMAGPERSSYSSSGSTRSSRSGGKSKRRRKRRIHITPRGYLVLGVLLLSVLLIVLLCILLRTGGAGGTGSAYAAAPSVVPGEGSLPATPGPLTTPESLYSPTPEPTPTPVPTEAPGFSSAGVQLPSVEQESGAVNGLVRASGVVLRKGAAKSYDIIRKCEQDEQLLIFAEKDEYYFVKTLSDHQYGYLTVKQVLKFGPLPDETGATPMPASKEGAVMGVVNVEEMYLRCKPTKEGNDPLGLCKKDALVWVYFQTDKWYYVELASSGEKGYLYAQYVQTLSAVPSGTPVP